MRNKEKIQAFKKKTIEELQEILDNPNSAEEDIVIASFEKHYKEDEQGISEYYSTEEVLERIFGKVKLA